MPDFFLENSILTSVFDHIRTLIDYTHVGIFYVEETEITLITIQGPNHPDRKNPIKFNISDSFIFDWIYKNEVPLLVADMEGDTLFAQKFRSDLDRLSGKPFAYIKSWVGFPLKSNNRTYGIFEVAHDERNHYTEKDVESLYDYIQTVSDQIENAVLKGMVKQHFSDFQAISTIDEAIFSQLDILELLQLVSNKAFQLTNANQIDIFLLEETFFSIACSSGSMPTNIYLLSPQNPYWDLIEEVLHTGKSARITNPSMAPPSFQEEFLRNSFRTLLIIPIQSSKEPIGVMVARDNIDGSYYNLLDERILKVLVNRASIALENAKLFHEEQERRRFTEELTRCQERQLIAQDLHDTVTQLLFRIGLEVNWFDQNFNLNEKEKERIQTIQQLIARSNEELRSAISVLRHSKMESNNNMIDMLKNQIDNFRNETGLETNLVISPNLGPLPFPIMEAIYRIVREALTNVHKHAGAEGVLVSLHSNAFFATVSIQDNGLGLFTEPPLDKGETDKHFGMDMMRQLATTLGGTILIDNNDDQGVIVKASFPLQVKDTYGPD